jgi:hypothetical protein
VTEAIFGLLGVVVGGLLQLFAQWQSQRREEYWTARRAGRLLTLGLRRCRFVLRAAADGHAEWLIVGDEVKPLLDQWSGYADVLAGTVRSNDDWNEVAGAIEALERVHQRAEYNDGDDMTDEDREFLGQLAERIWHAQFTTSLLGVTGQRRRRMKGLWWQLIKRIAPKRSQRELEHLAQYAYEADAAHAPKDDNSATEGPANHG